MLPEEAVLLSEVGNTLKYAVIESVTVCIALGLYIPVSVIALYILWQKGLRKPPVLVLFIIQVILILNSIWQVVIVAGRLLWELCYILVHSDSSLSSDWGLSDRIASLYIYGREWEGMSGWPGNLNLLVGDIVVLWRAWALWEHHNVVQWMLIILGICSGVLNIVTNLCASVIEKFPFPVTSDNLSLRLFVVNMYLVFSLALNTLATMLIAYKLWRVVGS
ncbi:hypothetical protein BDP27DRAFT_1374672 [Rhodocollybia butyracea]|uniref:Uncharacterized protein n=1 Tax=Rhodocollybia butyracea TaxID=206335 RepID=A0A9P5P7P3_9AGAR|nr:hypothetical protein BDP27DRAFT_1374672 [Rhodocollybia butyracea]